MGTYYGLGVATYFHAYSNTVFSIDKWKKILNERLDLDLYDVTINDSRVNGVLKEGIFQENIEDLYRILKEIAPYKQIDYYFKAYGTNIDDYDIGNTGMYLYDDDKNKIDFRAGLALLFIEGKVWAEEFSIEPKILNWALRHSTINNKLVGCIFGDIV